MALQFIWFIMCWTLSVTCFHAEDRKSRSGYLDPVITITDGATVYSSDSLFNKRIVTLIDPKKSIVIVEGNEIYIKSLAGRINKKIRSASVEKKKNKKTGEKIKKRQKPFLILTLISGPADKKRFFRGGRETGSCIILSTYGSKFYRKNAAYESKSVNMDDGSAKKHKLYHNSPLLSFFCRLRIPRGPPEIPISGLISMQAVLNKITAMHGFKMI